MIRIPQHAIQAPASSSAPSRFSLAVPDRTRRFNRWSLVLISCVVVASQGLYLFNRAGFWDGAMFRLAHERGRYAAVKALFWNGGVPPTYYLHRIIGLLPDPIDGYRLVYLASLIFSGYFLYLILVRAARLPRLVALMSGIFSVLMPFSVVSFDFSVVAVTVYMAIFLGGVNMLWTAATDPRRSSRAWRLSAMTLIALTFFYGTFLFIGMCAAAASAGAMIVSRRSFRAALVRLRRWPDLHVLPFAFAAFQRVFLTPSGRYERYNMIGLPNGEQWANWMRLPGKYWSRLQELVWPPDIPFGTTETIAIFMAVCVVGLIVLLSWPGRGLHGALTQITRWPFEKKLTAGAVSLVALYLMTLPHFLVGRHDMSFSGFLSRDNVPTSLATGTALSILVFLIPRSGVALTLAAALAMRLVFVQIDLARKWLDDELTLNMIAASVKQFPELEQAGVVLYDEKKLTHFNHLEWLEFQEVLVQAFGTETRVAFPTWELDRCESLPGCVEAFAPRRNDPLSEMAGARDAQGCGLVVKAHLERLPADPPTWSDYVVGHWGGPPLLALANARLRIVTTLMGKLPCQSPSPVR